jgi:pimeloyl-ACP methyl ester carboxylesterase
VPGRLIEFPYDWRLSNAYTAERLRATVMPRLETWRQERGNGKAKLILVCHSMGGLVARYFCEHLGGAAEVRRIFTFGTPHRGSLKALPILVNGKHVGPFDVGTVARALPSVWELLPQYPCVILDGKREVYLHDAGLAALAGPRFDAARQFQQRIRQPAEARPSGTCPYQQTVFFGKIQTTIQYARMNRTGQGEVITALKPGADGSPDDGGDGTVPSFASFPIELDVTSGGIPLLDKHAAMPAREAALEFLVNELNPVDISRKKAVDPTEPDLEGHVGVLDLPSEARAGEPVPVRVASSRREVVVQVIDHGRGVVTNTMTEQLFEYDSRGILSGCEIGPLAPGAYTIVAKTPGQPISDHLFVWDSAPPPMPAAGGELADLL